MFQQLTTQDFIQEFKQRVSTDLALDINDASAADLCTVLCSMVKEAVNGQLQKTSSRSDKEKQKQLYYFSIEFLPGRLLKSNLENMGWYETVDKGLKEMGLSLDKIAEAEKDIAIGNGGLGRLASSFMDSLASDGFPGNGNGIRYKYGMFKQKIINGYQVELPDQWLDGGSNWEIKHENHSKYVRFGGSVELPEIDGQIKPVYKGGRVIKAVPYDIGMTGYHNDVVNTMRLWDAEIPSNQEENYRTIEDLRKVEDLTSVLYPDDSTESGRRLRLDQEYFFVSAGLQSIIDHYLRKYNEPLTKLGQYIAVHINDTHPAMVIPEMMRLLMDEHGLGWDEAWDITQSVVSFTNHTIMMESMERWDINMMQQEVPRILQIIREIDRRFAVSLQGKRDDDFINRTRPIANGQVHMVRLAIIGSHSINGVAKLHTQLLETKVLHDFYELYPERFNNKTNGITIRRWALIGNRPLTKLLDKTIGTSWHSNATDLSQLLKYKDDTKILNQIGEVKLENKKALAAYIKKQTGITVDPTAIFDVQIKRLHAYKRQLLNLLRIVKLYFDIKDNPSLDIKPRVFIFAGKSAPSYRYAKDIIKCINEVANMVNSDPVVSKKIKVVFLENYGVSLAEKIIPAADVSEQISLASKEASGTSNMKLMLCGALTVATMDGANIEIHDYVGKDNIFTFGLTKDDVYHYYNDHSYYPQTLYDNDPVIKRVLNAFVDGTIPNLGNAGQTIFRSLTGNNDEFFVLKDFEPFVKVQEEVDKAYRDSRHWNQMALINIANAGHFSSDDTIKRYVKDIWHIKSYTAEDKANQKPVHTEQTNDAFNNAATVTSGHHESRRAFKAAKKRHHRNHRKARR